MPFVSYLGRTDSFAKIIADGVRRLDHSLEHERRVAHAVGDDLRERVGAAEVGDEGPSTSAYRAERSRTPSTSSS